MLVEMLGYNSASDVMEINMEEFILLNKEKRQKVKKILDAIGSMKNVESELIKKDGSMFKFVNRKQFLKIFPDSKNELKQFMKEHKIDLKAREDLVILVKYCNEVVE